MKYEEFDLNFSLDDKVSVISGAANGIGKAIAYMFAKKGARVVLCDKDDKVFEVAEDLKKFGAAAFQVDVTLKADITRMMDQVVQEYKAIDVLINCAGVGLIEKAEEMSEEMWDITLDVNLKAPFLMSQIAAKSMINSGRGTIINIASQAGVVGIYGHAAYSASKAGLIGLTMVCALEWGKYGITVNAVSPTVVVTEMGMKTWSGDKEKESIALIPVGRFGQPDEIAAICVYLASDAARLVNGANFVIDGGYSIQ